jgi:uracil-DNA glycosylase family 4
MVATGTPQRIVRGSLQGADCEHCPCARAGQPHRPVVGEGAEEPAWIAVGMEPGQTEILEQRPFCGPSGRVVNDALSKIRVDRDAIYVTNALCCLPQSGSSDSVKRKARECCAPRLQQELLQFPGRPILALGALAAQGFLGDTFSIMQMAGAYHEVDVADWPWKPLDVLTGTRQEVSDEGVITDVRVVIPSLHPADILRGGAGSAATGAHTSDLAFWALCYDAQKINLIARGVDIRFTDDVQIEAEDPVRAEALVALGVAVLPRQAERDRPRDT